MKLLHTADIHFSKEHQEEALASLAVIAETAERERPAAVVIAGDLWDRGVQNSASSGFPRLLAVIQRILEICPIAAVSGTPTHDLPGAYDVLSALEGLSFTMLQPGKAYALYGCGYVAEWGKREEEYDQPELLLLGMPEPTREWVLAGQPAGNAEETTQAMKAGLRSILLGMGALRAEHPEIPCVFVHHGAVEGATMQNGQMVGADDVTLGREDLALVGADYYALGHIHAAQQISGMPAYYPGSAYPVNWGERDVKGCNLVQIIEAQHEDDTASAYQALEDGDFILGISRIPFPHPPRAKFVVDWPEPVGPEADGVQAWVVYRATPEQAKKIDTESYLNSYLLAGSLPGSRVTVEVIPTETVRAAEITSKRALRDKVLVYAEAQRPDVPGVFIPDVPENVLAKADSLEREAGDRGAAAGGHWRLRRMRLRGAVGIWKGQRKDEIDINLDDYAGGLLALVGENGAGKSTLIENMHPFPCMLTRDGKLQDHFRLRDSARELWYTEELTGADYRILMEIDGANSTGAVKYHVFRSESAELCEKPLTNGRKEEYEAEILRLFGSLPLYLRSAFVSQRPTKANPDLSDASKGERKAIFRELAGLDYLQGYAEAAKVRGDALDGEIARLRAQAEILERLLEEEPMVREKIGNLARDIEQADSSLTEITAEGKAAAARVEELAKLVSEQERLEAEVKRLRQEHARKTSDLVNADRQREAYQLAIAGREDAAAIVARHAELSAKEKAENERLSGINKERARLSAQYGDALKAHREDAQKLEGKRFGLRTEAEYMEGDRKVLREKAGTLELSLQDPLTENCPTCGQLLPEAKRQALRDEREANQNHLMYLIAQRDALAKQIDAKRKEAEAITIPPGPAAPQLPAADETALHALRAEIKGLNVEKAAATLRAAEEATVRLSELETRMEALAAEIADLAARSGLVIVDHRPTYQEAQAAREAARERWTAAKEARAASAAGLEAAQKRLAELGGQRENLCALTSSTWEKSAEAAEWRYLERACGPDGIQALELDAMGPGISAEANALLSSAYGSRFSIEIRTTRIAGKGAKTKQVEDFAIWVHDSELGTEQPWETLSGGERTWVDRAVYGAFAIILDKSHGRRFLQHYYDEADGALDPEARTKYIAMLQEAHRAGGLRHTILITHSPEVQEAIGQKIEMRRSA